MTGPNIERVMLITAHPDDSEFGAGGSVARHVREGREVTYVIATNGNKGSSDRTMTPERLATIRESEQRHAARVLGVEHVEFLGYPDCELEDTRALRRDVTRQIRKWRPDLIITMQPTRTKNLYASHRDHRTIGSVALDCIYPLARDPMACPELIPEYEPHNVREVHLMQWDEAELIVDIAEVMDVKLKAIACHQSQFNDFAAGEARVRERAAQLGKSRQYAFAEAFDRIVMPR